MNDPYIDPSSGVLKNKLGINNTHDLSQAIGDFATSAQVSLTLDPPDVTCDATMLQQIHKRLFGKIFDWAGSFRTVQIFKGTDPNDLDDYFFDARFFDYAFANLYSELDSVNFFNGLSFNQLVLALSQNYAELNYIHPFREGNGRSQRVFWSFALYKAGWNIDWYQISKEENDRASFSSRITGDSSELVKMFTKHIEPLNEHALNLYTGHLLSENQLSRKERKHGISR